MLDSPHLPHDWVGEIASLGAIAGVFYGILPTIALLVAIAWYIVLIFESLHARRLTKLHITLAEHAAQKLLHEAAELAAKKVLDEAARTAQELKNGRT